MKAFLPLLLIASLPWAASASDQPWTEFELLREGTPPTLQAGPEFARAKSELRATTLSFARVLEGQAQSTTDECTEFVEVAGGALRTVAATIDHFKDPSWTTTDSESTLARSRLLLLVPSVQVLQKLFTYKRDGGYGTIDLRPRQTCAFKDRARVDREFTQLATELEAFRAAALGSPGLLPLERLTDDLLALADQQQSRYDTTLLVLSGTTLVSTLVLWHVAGLWAEVRFGLGWSWSRFGVLGLMGIVEGYSYEALDYFSNPEPEQRERPEIPSWDENMRDIKTLVNSSFKQPQLYLAYMSALQARLASLVGNWVQGNQDALNGLVAE